MRYLSKQDWLDKNPLLFDGEYGVERDTGKGKLGDGQRRWKQLSYSAAPAEDDSFGGGAGVSSVAGRSGDVILTASDVSGTFGDNQVPGSIARDTEVASAVSAAVASLVDSSPAALDTLKELADALGNDANFAATVNASLAARAVTVIHGSSASTARPTTSGPVVWYGSVTPTNLADGDVYVLVSSS